jgi:large subunit ribosomal protein L15e
MAAYRHMADTYRQEYRERNDAFKSRLTKWRSEPPIVKIDGPTNISRARELGYKAKQGVVVARVRVPKGLRKREKARKGRKPSKSGRFFARSKSLQSIAEERAARKFINCEVLNSYYVGEDGSYKFFETILIDASHPAIMAYKPYADALNRKGRVFRALTHAGREHRGTVQR